MQQADVEAARNRIRKAQRQVFRHRAVGKAVTVYRDAQRRQVRGLGGTAGEHLHVIGPWNLPADDALGVVVALNDEHRNAGPAEPRHLLANKQAGVKVLPVAVVEIAGDQQKIDPLVDGQIHQALERAPGRATQPFQRRAVVAAQPPQRAVDVKVGGVDKTHRSKLCF